MNTNKKTTAVTLDKTSMFLTDIGINMNLSGTITILETLLRRSVVDEDQKVLVRALELVRANLR